MADDQRYDEEFATEGGEDDIITEDIDDEIVDGLKEVKEGQRDARAMKFLYRHHPECVVDYVEQVYKTLPQKSYPPDAKKDPNHKSRPFMTQYEKTKMIGFRANQLSQGAQPYIKVPPHVNDVITIARMEMEERKLPFIVKRTMPDGTFEYWRLQDFMIQ
jgi:DNA-directed RNA polymerase subunit K/omega